MKLNVTDPFIESVAPFVTALLRSPKGKRPESVGTALLVEARGAHFLISAAHVLDEGNKLWFFPSKRNPRPVVGQAALSRPLWQKTGPDRFDIGVVRLAERLAEPYEGWHPVKIANLRAAKLDSQAASFAFVGYPSTRVKINPLMQHINLKYMALNGAQPAPANMYARLGFDPSSHLILQLDRAPVHVDGKTQQFPDPHGLSGSPVWSEDENGPCVVGIVTEYHKKEGVIVATGISHVLQLLNDAERDYAIKFPSGFPPKP
jgi:hypothetical protein